MREAAACVWGGVRYSRSALHGPTSTPHTAQGNKAHALRHPTLAGKAVDCDWQRRVDGAQLKRRENENILRQTEAPGSATRAPALACCLCLLCHHYPARSPVVVSPPVGTPTNAYASRANRRRGIACMQRGRGPSVIHPRWFQLPLAEVRHRSVWPSNVCPEQDG